MAEKQPEGKIILVDKAEVSADSYGSFLKIYALGGETFRIADKRAKLWAVFQGARRGEPILAIMQTYNNQEYIANARAITDEILNKGIQKLGERIADQANEEKNRSTSLSYSKDLTCAGKVDLSELYNVAQDNYNFIKGIMPTIEGNNE